MGAEEVPEDDEELQLGQGLPQDQVWRFLNNLNTANDAMTTVKRFIDRLGTQKSRSCQKSTKPAIHLRTLNEAQNQSKLPRSIFFGSHTVCEIHTYLFYLLTQKQQRGKDLYFLWREFGSERSRLITSQFLFDFLRKQHSHFYSYRPTYNSLQTFQTCSSCYPTQLLTLETEC